MNKRTEELIDEIGVSAGKDELRELENFRHEAKIRENLALELEEFSTLFEDVKIDDIPDEVWEECPDGRGLCAWYALFLRRRERDEGCAETQNARNSNSAVPDVKSIAGEIYFTPEAVQAMSEDEIGRNYGAILESMKKWK